MSFCRTCTLQVTGSGRGRRPERRGPQMPMHSSWSRDCSPRRRCLNINYRHWSPVVDHTWPRDAGNDKNMTIHGRKMSRLGNGRRRPGLRVTVGAWRSKLTFGRLGGFIQGYPRQGRAGGAGCHRAANCGSQWTVRRSPIPLTIHNQTDAVFGPVGPPGNAARTLASPASARSDGMRWSAGVSRAPMGNCRYLIKHDLADLWAPPTPSCGLAGRGGHRTTIPLGRIAVLGHGSYA